MKNKIIPIFALLLLSVVFTACHSNNRSLKGIGAKSSKTPVVTAFSAISVSVPLKANITVKDGATPSVQLNGYDNLLKHILVKVENGKLIIYSDLHWNISFSDDGGLTADITVPSLTGLELEGSPDADIHGPVVSDNFKLEISGSSSISVDSLNAKNLSVAVSGNGDVFLKGGTVQTATYDISGSGNIEAFPLQSQETTASISGSGDGEFTVLQKLTTSISGSGDIKYKGHPTVTQDVSGSGSITDANSK